MNQFKVGDVVRLKSGGPDMTVTKVEDDGLTWVAWFVKMGVSPPGEWCGPSHNKFPPEVLVPAVLEVKFAAGQDAPRPRG